MSELRSTQPDEESRYMFADNGDLIRQLQAQLAKLTPEQLNKLKQTVSSEGAKSSGTAFGQIDPGTLQAILSLLGQGPKVP
ncbi:MAG: hypothetical protein ACKPEY_04070 [Planctomycetota bacterium]